MARYRKRFRRGRRRNGRTRLGRMARARAQLRSYPLRHKFLIPIHRFKRMFENQYAITAGTDYYFAETFSLNLLPNYTEFTALFDQYRITGVKIKWQFSRQQVASNAGVNPNPIFRLWTVYDPDDPVLPTTRNELLQYETMRSISSNVLSEYGFSRYIRTNPNLMVYKSLIATAYGQPTGSRKMWLDVADSDIPHYGMKGVLTAADDAVAGGLLGTISFLYTYYLEFKTTR